MLPSQVFRSHLELPKIRLNPTCLSTLNAILAIINDTRMRPTIEKALKIPAIFKSSSHTLICIFRARILKVKLWTQKLLISGWNLSLTFLSQRQRLKIPAHWFSKIELESTALRSIIILMKNSRDSTTIKQIKRLIFSNKLLLYPTLIPPDLFGQSSSSSIY